MESLRTMSTVAPPLLIRAHLNKPIFSPSFTQKQSNLTRIPKSKLATFTAISPLVSTEQAAPPEEETKSLDQDEKFDWFSHWYALMPVCDLDKRAPLGKKVLGLDVVVWWDKNENEWEVFDDRCPHRLAPLSEGRIDQWGRLQCVYHGWCFNGSGDCKLIPQAPLDGPPVHSFSKACAAVYPSTVQNGIVWFWPNTDPQYKDILTKKKPPYIPEIDDPSFAFTMFNRDIPYGYEVLVENLMDPSHVPYAHHGIMKILQPSVKVDREGGSPVDIKIQNIDKNGFTTRQQPNCEWKFVPPCLLQGIVTVKESPDNTQEPQKDFVIFFCIPVSPGNCRLISALPRNFGLLKNPFVTRWMDHIIQNLVIDSDFVLLQFQERKLMELGPLNWQKAYFVATNADANVVAFRKWLNKYAGGQFDWGTKFNGSLLPSHSREQLLDRLFAYISSFLRYWTHVANCSSCNGAYKSFKALEVSLQVISVALVAIMAATKPGMLSVTARNTFTAATILCYVGSKWLAHFIYKNFHFHDYNHAFK